MLDSSQADSNTLYPTSFDELKINDMDEGQKIDGEAGNWSVLRYKNNFTLLLNNHPNLSPVLDFDDAGSLILFLKKN